MCLQEFVDTDSKQEEYTTEITELTPAEASHQLLSPVPISSTVLNIKDLPTPQLTIDLPSSPDKDISFIEQTNSMAEQQPDTLLSFMKYMAEQEARREERAEATRQEAAEREARLREEAQSREDKMLEMLQQISTKSTEVEQSRLAHSKEQLEFMAEQEKKNAKRREYEFNLLQEQAKKDKEEKQRQERIKQLPKPQPMAFKEDIEDYLELFEANMIDREQPKETWGHHLIPLLNPNCKAAVQSLSSEEKYDYKVVSEVLQKTCQQNLTYPGQQLLEGGTKYGESLRASTVRLLRLARRYAPEEEGEKVRNKMVMEIMLRGLPEDTANYVREKEPSEAIAAMDLASKHMAREGFDEFKFVSPNQRTYNHTARHSYRGSESHHGCNNNFKGKGRYHYKKK